MLTVKTYLDESTVCDGIGLFASEPIKKGTVVFVLDLRCDTVLDKHTIETLPSPYREFVKEYGYTRKDYPFVVLCGDNAKYANHSDNPNVGTGDLPERFDFVHRSIALRDIVAGEELTEDYAQIYDRQNDRQICQEGSTFFGDVKNAKTNPTDNSCASEP